MSNIHDIFNETEILDNEPITVTNPESGKKFVLTPEEAIIYSYIKGCELTGNYAGMQLGLDWFIENNIEAYMTLLD